MTWEVTHLYCRDCNLHDYCRKQKRCPVQIAWAEVRPTNHSLIIHAEAI